MKKYEQRGYDSNKGDIFTYDGIYRLTSIRFNSPEPTNPASEQFDRKRANEIIDETNYFEMKKTTDPPFKVRKFKDAKTWADYILGTKEEEKKKEEEEKDEK